MFSNKGPPRWRAPALGVRGDTGGHGGHHSLRIQQPKHPAERTQLRFSSRIPRSIASNTFEQEKRMLILPYLRYPIAATPSSLPHRRYPIVATPASLPQRRYPIAATPSSLPQQENSPQTEEQSGQSMWTTQILMSHPTLPGRLL